MNGKEDIEKFFQDMVESIDLEKLIYDYAVDMCLEYNYGFTSIRVCDDRPPLVKNWMKHYFGKER